MAAKPKAKAKKPAKKKAPTRAASKQTTKAKGKAPKSKTSTTARTVARKTTAAAPAVRQTRREITVRKSGFEKTDKTRTKSQVLKELADSTGLSKKELSCIFENLSELMRNDLTKGAGTFQVPGLVKFQIVRKPAVPARRGVNPFTGEEMMFKAKPARNVVKARPLKGLKDMVK